ncbi:MAG: hypothetical protein ACYC7E_09060 [Armatimonadota bacterium]
MILYRITFELFHSIRRRLLPATLLLVCLLPSIGIAAEYGLLSCRVRYEDGDPYVNSGVAVQAGGRDYRFVTSAAGLFSGVLPAGMATLTVADNQRQVEIKPGEQAEIEFILKRYGIYLQISNADGTPYSGWITSRYKTPSGERSENPTLLAPGRYALPNAPAQTTALSIKVGLKGRDIAVDWRQIWQFEKEENCRKLTVTLPPLVPLRLTVIGNDGAPIPNAKATVTLRYPSQVYPDYWSDPPAQPALSTIQLQASTNAIGVVDLGTLPAQHYEIRLRVEDMVGGRTPFEITPAGKVSIRTYSVSSGRGKVTQTVFDRAGKPAAQADVFASYAWGGKFIIRHFRADAQGAVVWTDLPPVRVIVSGPAVAPGVLPADALQVSAPLPAPRQEDLRTMAFRLRDDESKPLPYAVVLRTPDGPMGDFRSVEQVAKSATPAYWDLPGGVPLEITLAIGSSPPRVGRLHSVYLPYLDDESPRLEVTLADLPVTYLPMTEVRGRLLTKEGQPVAGASRLGLAPLAGNALYDFLADPRLDWLLQPKAGSQGTFTCFVPCSGGYRLLVDLYDEGVPPAPQMIVTPDAKTPVQHLAVTLPAPLAGLPGGTRVSWLTRNAPRQPRTLILREGEKVPVYGPREDVPALWHRPDENRLVIYTPSDLAQPRKVLQMRTVMLQAKSPQGNPFRGGLRLTPCMLPGYPGTPDGQLNELESTIRGADQYTITLWPGQYQVSEIFRSTGIVATFTVKNEDNQQITFKVNPEPLTATPVDSLRLRFPPGDVGRWRKQSLGDIRVAFDYPSPQPVVIRDTALGLEPVLVDAPLAANSVTIWWPGVGVMRNVPLPARRFSGQEIVLPAWSAGVTISGRLLRADGKPFANAPFLLFSPLTPDAEGLSFATDAAGSFTLTGAAPGKQFLLAQQGYAATWILDAGRDVSGITLRENAYIKPAPMLSRGSGDLWWLPAAGTPVQVPEIGRRFFYGFPPGQNRFWCHDGDQGSALYVFDMPGDVLRSPSASAGPSLSLSFPLNGGIALPGSVTLIGRDALAGLRAVFPHFAWAPSAILEQFVGQIDALPPGNYTVVVDTTRGKVERPVTVGPYGGNLKLDFPAAK